MANVSFQAPTDYSAEQADIERRRQYAQMLQQQGMEPTGGTQMAGGWAIKNSPFSGLANALKSYGGRKGQEAATEEQKQLGQRYQSDLAQTLMRAQQAGQGTPASTSPGSELSPEFATPAVAPDRQAMARILMSHPGTAPLGMAQMQKDMELAQRQQMMGSIMGGQGTPGAIGIPGTQGSGQQGPISSTQAMQMIASGDPGLAAVGQAALKQFSIPAAEQAKLTQSEQHFQGVSGNTQAQLGQAKELHAIPSASAVLGSETTRRGQDMTNARSLEMNGILQGGGLSPESEKMAQAIANGQLAPLSGFALNRPGGRAVMSRVMELNPNYSGKDFGTGQKAEKDFATGKQGQAVKSFNVALSHLDTLDQLAGALHNGDTLLLNKASNLIATQTGQPAPTNFNAAKKIVGDEIVKAIVGAGGGVSDREDAAKTISAANSPAQLKGVINTYKELMRGQLGGLRQQYETSTGRKDFDRFLSESGKATSHGGAAPTSDVRSQADAILGNR